MKLMRHSGRYRIPRGLGCPRLNSRREAKVTRTTAAALRSSCRAISSSFAKCRDLLSSVFRYLSQKSIRLVSSSKHAQTPCAGVQILGPNHRRRDARSSQGSCGCVERTSGIRSEKICHRVVCESQSQLIKLIGDSLHKALRNRFSTGTPAKAFFGPRFRAHSNFIAFITSLRSNPRIRYTSA